MSTALRRASRTTAAFDPIAGVGWARAYWAGGPEFAALGVADAGSVATWPDEVGTSDATEATNQPVYRASVAALNGRPAIDFDGTNDVLITGAWTQAQPFTIIWIGVVDDAATGLERVVQVNPPGTYTAIATDTNFYMYAGTAWNGSSVAYGSTAHMIRAFFSGASSVIVQDATSTAAATAGTAGAGTSVTIGGGAGSFNNNHTAFVGLYAGQVTSDGGWTDFKAWVTSHYGITT